MSVTEKAEIPCVEGKEAEFEAVLPKALPVLRAAAGCHSVSIAKGIENPSTYLLLVEWNDVEAHTSFTKTAEFGEFVSLIKEFFAGPPGAVHYTPLHAL